MILTEAMVIAIAHAIEATAKMVVVIVDGQPPEIRKAAWERWNAAEERWEKILSKLG